MVMDVNIYGQLLGWIPVWVWIVLGGPFLLWGGWMWFRIWGSRTDTVQHQRDTSHQWARRSDVDALIMNGPDSRRLPLGTLITGNRRKR